MSEAEHYANWISFVCLCFSFFLYLVGQLDTGLTRKITHLVTTITDLHAATYRCKMAIKYGTTVVGENWIRESINIGELAKKHVLRPKSKPLN